MGLPSWPSRRETIGPGRDRAVPPETVTHGSDSPPAWLTRERINALAFLTLTLLALIGCAVLLWPFVPALAWALALGVLVEPLHARLARRLHWRNVSAAIAVMGVAVVLIGPATGLANAAAQQLAQVADRTNELSIQSWRGAVSRVPYGESLADWIDRRWNIEREWQRVAETLAGRATTLVTGTVWAGAQFLITLFALFYFLRDCRPTLATLRQYSPLSDPETNRVFAQVAAMIHATVYGTLIVATVQGFLGGLMFWWLGLPAPVLWGLVMAVLSLIPMAGSFVVWFPAAVMFALQGDWTRAFVLLVWGAAIIGLIDNLLYPLLVGHEMRLHTLPVFFAIVGGIVVIGASGIILGPVLLAVTVALLDVWRSRTMAGQPAEVPRS
jgi:predicted PurR-regulated permease PerM